MPTFAEALSNARQWSTLFQSFKTIETTLDACAQAEQFLGECQTRTAAAQADEATARQNQSEANVAADAATKSAIEIAASTNKQVADMLAAAQVKADEIVAATNAQRDQILDAANAALSIANAEVKDRNTARDLAVAATDAAQTQLDSIRAAIAAATKV